MRVRWGSNKFLREGWRVDSGPQYILLISSKYDDGYIIDGEIARVTWLPQKHCWVVWDFLNDQTFEVRQRHRARRVMQHIFDERRSRHL